MSFLDKIPFLKRKPPEVTNLARRGDFAKLIEIVGDQSWDEIDPTIRTDALGCLDSLGELGVVDSAQREQMERLATESLARIRDKWFVDWLITTTSHPNPQTAGWAAKALGEMRQRKAVEALIAALGLLERDHKCPVVEALGKIGDARAVEPLARLLSDSMPLGLAMCVPFALAKLGDNRGAKIMMGLIRGERIVARYRLEAAHWLGEVGRESDLPELLKVINSLETSTGSTVGRGEDPNAPVVLEAARKTHARIVSRSAQSG